MAKNNVTSRRRGKNDLNSIRKKSEKIAFREDLIFFFGYSIKTVRQIYRMVTLHVLVWRVSE